MPNRTLYQLTLNTGHVYASPRRDVRDYSLRSLSPLLGSGGGPIPGRAPWRFVLARTDGAATFDIRRAETDVAVLCGVAWTKEGGEQVWPSLEKTYHKVTDAMLRAGLDLGEALTAAPEMPATLPWLGCILLPSGLVATAQSDLSWLGDFERCLAWALLEDQPGRVP